MPTCFQTLDWLCPVILCGAEKSGHGDEEGRHQGADHVDRVPGGSVRYSLRLGVLDIAKCAARVASPFVRVCCFLSCVVKHKYVYELHIFFINLEF